MARVADSKEAVRLRRLGMYPLNTRFLIVDDQSSMRKTICDILAEMGYHNSVQAEDGQNAFDILKLHANSKNAIEFIVSDWNMPIMTGLDLLKKCRGSIQFKDIPFMLVTGEREQSQIVEAAKAGVSDYLLKPFSAIKIKDKIEKIYIKNPSSARKAA